MRSKIYLTLSLLLLLALGGLSFNHNMNAPSAAALTYLVRQPKIATTNPPLVILLHGVGGNEQNMFSLADALPDHFLVVSARGPLQMSQNSYAWFQVQFTNQGPVIQEEQAESSRKTLIHFIDELKEELSFNPDQVYLMGFSQGGIMSYSVALTEPEKIAGIVVMSSRLLPEVKPLVADAERLKKLKIFISHGTQDAVLRNQYAIDAISYLKSKGLSPEYHPYDEGHRINERMLNDAAHWLANSQ